MKSLGKLWAGHLYGTNTGNLFLTLQDDESELSGKLRFQDDRFGTVVYEVSGTNDDQITLKGIPASPPIDGVDFGEMCATAYLSPEGNLRGTWETTTGTGGTFVLFPHGSGQTSANASKTGPEQFFTQSETLGALLLGRSEVEKLIETIRSDFDVGRPIVTYCSNGPETTRFADDFLSSWPEDKSLRYLKVHIQEPDLHQVNRVITVEFSANGANTLFVQGVRESWVLGQATKLTNLLKASQSAIITTYKKFGLNINTMILLALLIFLPELENVSGRAIFVGSVAVLLALLYWVHSRFIPNVSIYTRERSPSTLERLWPSLTSWFLGVFASVAAAMIFEMINRNF